MNFKSSTPLIVSLVLLFSASACGSSSDESSPNAESPAASIEESPIDTTQSPTEETASSSVANSLGQIADLICDAAPERLGAEAEMFTETSWMCTFGEDQVRIDEYEDQGQLEEARAMVLSIYTSADPTASLADYPFVCGDLWVAGFDYNETRDVAIELLNAAGINAGTC